MNSVRRFLLVSCVGLISGSVDADDARPEFSPEQIEFFEKKIRPIFVEHCHECHAGDEPEAGLLLTSREAILQGGDTGPAVVPGMLDEGELLQAVSYDPVGYQMPPDGKLPGEKIELLRQWVAMGAPWPDEAQSAGTAHEEFDLAARATRFSFQPLQPTRPPEVNDTTWPRTPIDRFLLAKLEAAGLMPAPATDRRTWLRRACFDTIGLPPTPEQVRAFLDDHTPGSYERVVDGLLASPHFGERWGRHWLDLVRYAESRGHEFDYDIPNPWHYRDYVIRALNDDVPYDQFVVEHVAGDLLQASGGREPTDFVLNSDWTSNQWAHAHRSPVPLRLHPQTGANESILGTGFWFLGEWVHSPVDIRQEEADRFDNMVDVYSKTFLGLTVACARCHDHKFDPIRQSDFYALQGYLQSSSYRQARFETMEHNRRVAEELARVEQRLSRAAVGEFGGIVEQKLWKLDDYLQVSRGIIEASLSGPALDERTEELAIEHDLDSTLLSRWVSHLQAAKDDPDDPFYLWGLLVAGKSLEEIRDEAHRIVEELSAEADDSDWSTAVEQGRLINARQFTADGVGFRLPTTSRPLVYIGETPEQPLRGFSLMHTVEWDPHWESLAETADTMRDPGKIEGWHRAGRTLRTPTFKIDRDRLYILLRGAVHIYLSVDSHILINGPLHGGLLSELPSETDWRWVELNVSRYREHRAHLEFTPLPGEDFAVSEIWLRDKSPPSTLTTSQSCGLSIAFGVESEADYGGLQTAEDLATLFRDEFRTVIIDLLQYPSDRPDLDCPVPKADWMLNHPGLFGLDSDESRRRFQTTCAELFEERSRLVESIRAESATAPAMLQGSAEEEYVFIRGNWNKRGETVPRRFLEVFNGHGPSTLNSQLSTIQGSGRLDLALQMVNPDQTPILPRVIVNRIWQHYFGRGIVPTPDDFGHMGQEPSHPELLDWLADELIAHDWSLKHIHRQILLSAAYRMDSSNGTQRESNQPADAGRSPDEMDPQNVLVHRMNVKRMEGEIIRDAVLSVSGRLDEVMYGRSVPVHLTPFMEGRGRPAESGPVDGNGRRSIYIAVRRNFAEPFFQAFDFPNPHTTIGRRSISNVPAQALALMNNPLIVQQSRVWAERLLAETGYATAEERVIRLYETAFSRPPTDDELGAGTEFVEAQAAEYNCGIEDVRVWSDYCHVLVNVKEFVFVR